MNFGGYERYDASPIEWLDRVPAHWHSIPIKYLALNKESLFLDGDWIESKDLADAGIRYLTTGNVGEGNYKEQGSGFITEKKFDELNCTEVFAGDMLVSRLNRPIGRSCIVPDLGQRIVTSVDNVIVRADSEYLRQYLVYLFSSKDYFRHTDNLSRGATMQRISRGLLGNIRIVVPSLEEQKQIAAFLDYETAKIDALIEKQQQLIALLGEKRQAVISHAVTKGLNPDAPMRDSGVEWLGEVPAHWEVYRLKHLATSIKAGPFGSSLTKDVYVKSGYRVYGQEQVIPNDFSIGDYYISDVKFKEMSQYSVSPGDVLISCVGTFGKIAIVPETAEPGIINPRLLRLCCSSAVSPEYLVEVLRSQVTFEQFSILSRGGTMDIINIGTLSSIVVPLPPADEQLLLLDYIGSSSRKFEKLIEAANAMVDLLKERRTAIISAAVTGKIDVRNWKPPADERPQKSNKEAA